MTKEGIGQTGGRNGTDVGENVGAGWAYMGNGGGQGTERTWGDFFFNFLFLVIVNPSGERGRTGAGTGRTGASNFFPTLPLLC